MSRSLGDLSLTTSPPMLRVPELMSSSPAIMLSVVDFGRPIGEALGDVIKNDLSHWILLSGLALDRARRQPCDDPALEKQHEDDDRNGDDHRCRGDRPGGHREL